MYETEAIMQIESAHHDAAARDGDPHALWGGMGTNTNAACQW